MWSRMEDLNTGPTILDQVTKFTNYQKKIDVVLYSQILLCTNELTTKQFLNSIWTEKPTLNNFAKST